MRTDNDVIREWREYVEQRDFPCVAAKAAQSRDQINVMAAGHMACPKDDKAILDFIYNFIEGYRNSDKMFHSAVIIFEQPENINEELYEKFFWQRLQALSDLDAQRYGYDHRVDPDPHSENFSFSLKEEAFFVIGMHPANSRPARRFKYPAIVFNPHSQFEKLREDNQYDKMKNIVRKRDMKLAGSINLMLNDFGDESEAYQYTGQQLDKNWKCPLHIHHERTNHNQSA